MARHGCSVQDPKTFPQMHCVLQCWHLCFAVFVGLLITTVTTAFDIVFFFFLAAVQFLGGFAFYQAMYLETAVCKGSGHTGKSL